MQAKGKQGLTEAQRHWLMRLRACEASGQSMKEYATGEGIDVQALYAWKKALVKKGVLPRTRRARFQRAQVAGPVGGSEWRIQLPNGVSVAFAGAVDAGTLTTVLSAAAALG
jgi:hypothetical protein